MAVLTRSGRTGIARSIATRPLHVAWGRGDGAWTAANRPVETLDETALISEIGRRAITSVSFCLPSATGEIVVPTGKFTASLTPTNYLYIKCTFDFEDASTETIREVAVFTETVVNDGLPPGQRYFYPTQIKDPGTLLVVENINPQDRSPAVRESYEFVIAF